MYGAKVTKTQAASLIKNGAKGFDIRDAVDFRDDPISGSVNISLRRVSEIQRLPKTDTIVVIGDTTKDKAALEAALHYLFVYGFGTVRYVDCADR
jgi:rhodanese-related sulfurtransferase